MRDDLAWQDDALCAEVSMDLFFPEKGDNSIEARKICAECDVKNQCLEYAQRNVITYGIWGGVAPQARRHLRLTA